jgi:hypothetical protein
LALGHDTPAYGWYVKLPMAAETVRSPFRLFWVTGFCLSMLVALGLQAVLDRGTKQRARWVALGVTLVVVVAFSHFTPRGLRWTEACAAAGIVTALLLASVRPQLSGALTWVLAGAVVLNLVGVPLRWLGSLQPSVDVLWRHAGAFASIRPTVTAEDRALFLPSVAATGQLKLLTKMATILRLPDFGDYEGLLGNRFWSYYQAMWQGNQPGTLHRRLLDAAAIRYLIGSPKVDAEKLGLNPSHELLNTPDLQVYLNDTALRRSRYVSRIEVVPDPAAVLARIAAGDTDLTAVAFVEEPLPSGFTGVDGPHRPGTTQVVRNDPEHLEIRVDAPQRGFLVLTDRYYPGWRATVNGTEVPIHLANHMFRLVEVPAGSARVEFLYRPASLKVGALISLATSAALVFAAVYARRRS